MRSTVSPDTRGRRGGLLSACLVLMLAAAAPSAVGVARAQEPVPHFDPQTLDAIDAFVLGQMDEMRIPGLALAMVQGTKIVHLRGFGVADGSGREITPRTPFILGSTSKAFTAIAVMQLVEEGLVELDAPVQRYIPWFRVADEGASGRTTVRHLLHHQGGFSWRTGIELWASDDTSPEALERGVRRLADVELAGPVGGHQYSNTNYDILGLLVQEVSGRSFEQYLQERVFAPLDMRTAFLSREDAREAGLAAGYFPWFGLFVRPTEMPYPRGLVPSGFMIASVEDMAHAVIAHLNDGEFRGNALLAPESIEALHRPSPVDGRYGYAMGWHAAPLSVAMPWLEDGGAAGDTPLLWHPGQTSSYNSYVVMAPGERWGFAWMINVSDQTMPGQYEALTAGIAALLLGQPPPPADASGNPLRQYGKLLLLGMAVLQVAGLIAAVSLLRHWRERPGVRPTGAVGRAACVGVPLAVDAAFILAVFVVVPRLLDIPLGVLLRVVPDAGLTALLVLALGAGWGSARSALMLAYSRRSAA